MSRSLIIHCQHHLLTYEKCDQTFQCIIFSLVNHIKPTEINCRYIAILLEKLFSRQSKSLAYCDYASSQQVSDFTSFLFTSDLLLSYNYVGSKMEYLLFLFPPNSFFS